MEDTSAQPVKQGSERRTQQPENCRHLRITIGLGNPTCLTCGKELTEEEVLNMVKRPDILKG